MVIRYSVDVNAGRLSWKHWIGHREQNSKQLRCSRNTSGAATSLRMCDHQATAEPLCGWFHHVWHQVCKAIKRKRP